MKKTLSLILALMMMLSSFAFAEGGSAGESAGEQTTMSAADVIDMANASANSEEAAAAAAALEADCAFAVIPADETTGQIRNALSDPAGKRGLVSCGCTAAALVRRQPCREIQTRVFVPFLNLSS